MCLSVSRDVVPVTSNSSLRSVFSLPNYFKSNYERNRRVLSRRPCPGAPRSSPQDSPKRNPASLLLHTALRDFRLKQFSLRIKLLSSFPMIHGLRHLFLNLDNHPTTAPKPRTPPRPSSLPAATDQTLHA